MRKFEGQFMSLDKTYDDAEIVVFGAPYDGTTSYRPGTRFASSVMRNDFEGLESYSPYLDKDLAYVMICDAGDLELPFGNVERVLEQIEKQTAMILKDGKKPFMIGGEHLVTLGSMRAIAKEYPNVHILHFDAHADLRSDYMGEALSHATVIRRSFDLFDNPSIYQFGIRSGTKDEFMFAKQHTTMEKFTFNNLEEVLKKIGHDPVYVTIDLDVLDPSVFPGTGTPEPGGVTFDDLLKAVHLMEAKNVIGADIVELSPHYDQTGASTAVACKVMRELLLAMGTEK